MSATVTAVSSTSANTSNRQSGRTSNRDKKSSSSKSTNNSSSGGNSVMDNQEKNQSENNKLQPTAEQIRIADLMNDRLDDNDLQNKVRQIMEVTGATQNEAVVALHDCDNDPAKAIDMIFEGETIIDSEWKSTGKKKKPQKSVGVENDHSRSNGNKDVKSDELNGDGKGSAGVRQQGERGGRGKAHSGVKVARGAPPRMQRAAQSQRQEREGRPGGVAANRERRPAKDSTRDLDSQDTFNDAHAQSRRSDGNRPSEYRSEMRGELRGEARRGRGRGTSTSGVGASGSPPSLSSGTGRTGAGRGSTFTGPNRSRTFQNRVLQNDGGFPKSIDTWTNSTAESGKQPAGDVNTMTVGNWSDIVNNEDWNSEEDWDSNAMNETKVFTSTKALSSDKEREFSLSKANTSSNNTQSLDFTSLFPHKSNASSVDPSARQPTMSSILRGTSSSNANTTNVSGAALLQQLQQSTTTQAPPISNQYSLSSFNKQATESIKSLVGISPVGFSSITDTHGLDASDNSQSARALHAANMNNKQRVKSTRSSKIPESAVEMPSHDSSSLAALEVSFGSLDFGVNNSDGFSMSNVSFQDTFSQAKKNVATNQGASILGSVPDTYRTAQSQQHNMSEAHMSNKSVPHANNVLHQLTGESLLDRSSKAQQQQSVANFNQQKVNQMDPNSGKNVANKFSNISASQQGINSDISSSYKSSYDNTGYNNSNNYSASVTTSYSYSQPSSAYGNYTSNFPSATSSHMPSSGTKLNMDNPNQQKQHYDHLSNASMANSVNAANLSGMVSNTTNTTNVLKTSLSATGKGGVQNVTQQPMLGHHYMALGSAIFPFPAYSHPADAYSSSQPVQQQRDHNVNTYPLYNNPQDIKYTRGSESDVTSQAVSTSQAAIAAPSQAHNQPIAPLPPGYGYFIHGGMNVMPGMPNMQNFYSAPLAYAAPLGTNTASASSAFPKPASGYASHNYSSGYDALSGVAQHSQDYSKSNYGQGPASSQQQHKNIGPTSGVDLANAGIHKSAYNMNKNYDKQAFAGSTPASFNLSGGTQSSASGSGYAAPYILSQPLHHNLQNDPNQVGGGVGVGGQRSISQTHSRSTGPQAPSTQKYYQSSWGN